MTARQLILDLPFRTAMGRDDFFVTEANAAAVAGIDGWRDWPLSKMVMVGPEGAGKSHLMHVWASQSGAEIVAGADLTEAAVTGLTDAAAVAVEDCDAIAGEAGPEELLFHLHNALAQRRTSLLLTARTVPARWGLCLPDLKSRMLQAGQLGLAAPDDPLLAAVLMKLSQDRGLVLPPQVLNYVLPRIDRSLAMAGRFIAALDEDTLSAKEKPGLKHAKAVLSRLQG